MKNNEYDDEYVDALDAKNVSDMERWETIRQDAEFVADDDERFNPAQYDDDYNTDECSDEDLEYLGHDRDEDLDGYFDAWQ